MVVYIDPMIMIVVLKRHKDKKRKRQKDKKTKKSKIQKGPPDSRTRGTMAPAVLVFL